MNSSNAADADVDADADADADPAAIIVVVAATAAERFVPARALEPTLGLRSLAPAGDPGEGGTCDTNDPLRLLLLYVLGALAIPRSAAIGLNAAGGKANECSAMASTD